MREIINYIRSYFTHLNKIMLATCTLMTGLMIYINFSFHLDQWIEDRNSIAMSFYYRYIIFFLAFVLPYSFYFVLSGKNYFKNPLFIFLILIAPAIFSWKIAMSTEMQLTGNYMWNYYWNQVIYWPVRLITMALILAVIWKIFYRSDSFFGMTTRNFQWKPYLLMLLIMIPLIAAASTQQDFLNMYPKLKDVTTVLEDEKYKWFYHLLHELSYGSDFISVELFFRGFLILAFVKFAGKDAILPMACFYCTIHFGKPLGECISSYFGGLILGIVVFHTRSIIGGLMVHLGIAWLMELGGWIGNTLNN
jgi:hypothetical protein